MLIKMASKDGLLLATAVISSLLIATALKIKNNRINKRARRRLWMKRWLERRDSGRGLLNMVEIELAQEDIHAYRNFMRMPQHIFYYILNLIKDDIQKQDTHMRLAISPEKRLAITLRYLATGESFRSLMYSMRIHESTISKIVSEVCLSIYNKLKNKYLKVPRTVAEWEAVAEDFFVLWNFPNCLGAMDGKHINIKAPENSGSYYYNYKGHHSIVLLAVADAKYRFIYVDVGVNGRISDGGVFRVSSMASAIAGNSLNFPPMRKLSNESVKLPYVFVADDAFPLTQRIMKPYPQRGLSNEKCTYNHRLSRARRVVENAFGIMSSRFRIFLTTIALCPQKVDTIVLAATALHNLLITSNISRERYLEGNIEANAIESLGLQSGRRPVNFAIQIREEFQRYFVSHPM